MSVLHGEEDINSATRGELHAAWKCGGSNQSRRLGLLEMEDIANGAETSKREDLFHLLIRLILFVDSQAELYLYSDLWDRSFYKIYRLIEWIAQTQINCNATCVWSVKVHRISSSHQ